AVYDPAAARQVESAKYIQQRGFAAPRRTQQYHEFVFDKNKVNTTQRMDRHLERVIGADHLLVQENDGQNWHITHHGVLVCSLIEDKRRHVRPNSNTGTGSDLKQCMYCRCGSRCWIPHISDIGGSGNEYQPPFPTGSYW